MPVSEEWCLLKQYSLCYHSMSLQCLKLGAYKYSSSVEDYVTNILASSNYLLDIIGLLFIFSRQVIFHKKLLPLQYWF